MINYHLILGTLYSDKQWSMSGENYSGLDWLDSSPKPTKEELDSRQSEAESIAIANQEAAKNAKQNALNKLMALGLTEEEALALGVK